MKLITAIIKPSRLDPVLDALKDAGCGGITNSGMRLVTVTVTYVAPSATGKDSALPRSVIVTMLVAQR